MATLKGRDTGCSLLILFHIIVVPALIITLRAEVCNAVDDNLYCSNNTYSIGSDFERNLNTVFNSLVQHTHQTGFNTSVYGQSPNRVYGLLQCRGDATVDQCYNCSRNATTIINYSQNCGNADGGRIWLDFCFLRYQTDNFIGQLDTQGYYLYQYYDLSSPDKFNAARDKLLSNLSSEVAYGSSRNRYASGVTSESFPTIYALAQCTRDISDDDCTACLTKATDEIRAYYNGTSGVQYFMGSCILSYEIHRFFNLHSPAEAPANAPVAETRRSPPNTTEAPSNTHSKIPTILGVVVGGLLLAVLVWVFTTRRGLKGYEVHQQVQEDILINEDRQILTFKMEELVAATENFNDDNKLGQGGFGPVYKGTTHDGKEIAVKKLSINSTQGMKEFLTEVKLVAKIQHRNLVKLLGCCAEGSEKLLSMSTCRIAASITSYSKRYNILIGRSVTTSYW